LPDEIFPAVYITDNFNNSGQGAGVFSVSYVDGVSTPAGYNGEIAQGQAFWVKATANTTLQLTESVKIIPTNTQFYREGQMPNVLRVTIEGAGEKDEAVLRLREGASDKFDRQYDAHKFFEPKISLASLTSDNVSVVINSIGTGDCSQSVRLVANVESPGNYQFNFSGIETFDALVNPILTDAVTKKSIDLRTQENYSFVVTDADADLLSTRFQVSFSTGSNMAEVSISKEGSTLQLSGAQGIYEWYLDDVMLEGQVSDKMDAFTSGVYTAMVINGGCATKASVEVSNEDLLSYDGISVYPNPTHDKVRAHVKSQNNNVKAILVNSSGVEIETQSLTGEDGVKQGQFDLLPHAAGIYYVKIFDGSKIIIKKVAKVN
jgi:hypothetical protein